MLLDIGGPVFRGKILEVGCGGGGGGHLVGQELGGRNWNIRCLLDLAVAGGGFCDRLVADHLLVLGGGRGFRLVGGRGYRGVSHDARR